MFVMSIPAMKNDIESVYLNAGLIENAADFDKNFYKIKWPKWCALVQWTHALMK